MLNEAAATMLSKPSAPRDLAAAAGDGHVTLSWTPPLFDGGRPVTAYRVYRGLSAVSLAFIIETGNVTTYNDTSLKNGQRQYYAISAKNQVGEGPSTAEISATPGAVPGPPRAVEATAGSGRVGLSWLSPSDDGGFPILNYRIFRGTTSGQEALLAETGVVTEFSDSGLTNGQTYYYVVAAVNSLGQGSDSAEASATPVDARPTCWIVSPQWSATISGTHRIVGVAGDEEGHLERVEVKIDDGEWTNATGLASWTYDWTTTGLTNDLHRIYARSFDGGNYSSVMMVSVFVENVVVEEHIEKSVFEEPWFWAVTSATMVAVILMLVLILRSRRNKDEGIESFLEYLGDDEKQR